MAIAAVLASEMKSLLLGEAATPEQVERIEAEIAAVPAVVRVIHVLTQHLGPEELLVATKVELERSLSVPEVAAAINECEARIRAAVPIARRIYIEPDLIEPEPPPTS